MAEVLKKLGAKKPLIVDAKNETLAKSTRNLVRTKYLATEGLNVYDVLDYETLRPHPRHRRDGDRAAEAGSERRSCIMSRPAHQIIRRPLLTEKGTRLKETGGAPPPGTFTEETLKPQVLFEVALTANKIEIKQAIESLFSVKVVDVHTQIMRGKEKRIGRYMGMRSNWKKAIVTLAQGNKIEFFEGV